MNNFTKKRLERKIERLTRKKESLKEYNLSGSGWKDSYSSSERDSLYSHNDAVNAKRIKIDRKIFEINRKLEEAGYNNTSSSNEAKQTLSREEFTSEINVEETPTINQDTENKEMKENQIDKEEEIEH